MTGAKIAPPLKSPEGIAAYDFLKENELHLTHNEATTRGMGKIVFLTLSSPMAVGKTSIAEEICRIDPDFFQAQGIPTRPQRSDEKLGESRAFWSHDDESILKIKDLFVAGKVVQYTVLKATGFIYFSTLEDYRPGYNVCPIAVDNLAQLYRAPYKRVQPVGIVCTGREFDARLHRRASSMEPNDVTARLENDFDDLKTMLEMDIPFVHNAEGQLTATARACIAIARQKQEREDKAARQLAEELLQHLGGLTGKHK